MTVVPPPGAGPDVKGGSHHTGTVAHHVQSQAASGLRFGVETDAVILDCQPDLLRVGREG